MKLNSRLSVAALLILSLTGCANLPLTPQQTTVSESFSTVAVVPSAGLSATQTLHGVAVSVQIHGDKPGLMGYRVTLENNPSFFSDIAKSASQSTTSGADSNYSTYDATLTPVFEPTAPFSGRVFGFEDKTLSNDGSLEEIYPTSGKVHFKVTITNNGKDVLEPGNAFVAVKLNGVTPTFHKDFNCKLHYGETVCEPVFLNASTNVAGDAADGRLLVSDIAPGQSESFDLAGPEIADMQKATNGQGTMEFAIYDLVSYVRRGSDVRSLTWRYTYTTATGEVSESIIRKSVQIKESAAKQLSNTVVTDVDAFDSAVKGTGP